MPKNIRGPYKPLIGHIEGMGGEDGYLCDDVYVDPDGFDTDMSINLVLDYEIKKHDGQYHFKIWLDCWGLQSDPIILNEGVLQATNKDTACKELYKEYIRFIRYIGLKRKDVTALSSPTFVIGY